MAPGWRDGARVLTVALGILQCCGWLSGQTLRTSVNAEGPMSHERVKRGWVWNQFFVVEEYTGTEPLYVGKVNIGFLLLLPYLRAACTYHEDSKKNL